MVERGLFDDLAEVCEPDVPELTLDTPEQADVTPDAHSLGETLFGTTLFGDSAEPTPSGPLALRFTVPPFSILSAREGDWQARKRAWISLGIEGELGRGDNGTNGERTNFGKCLETGIGDKYGRKEMNATSIFDPVLCELAYRWWCQPGGQVVDPFAGGSVRGLVAGVLGHRYHGIELRPEQVAANLAQRDMVLGPYLPGLDGEAGVAWVCGDARALLKEAPLADLVFSCPPYGDLEVYSDDPRDLSAMPYPAFLVAYRGIIARCAALLKPDRCACWVVGDFRDKATGYYRGFVADTILAFREAGLALFNDAILATSVGSLPIRVSAQFEGNRKLGKTHQNVLVFTNGDPRKAFHTEDL